MVYDYETLKSSMNLFLKLVNQIIISIFKGLKKGKYFNNLII